MRDVRGRGRAAFRAPAPELLLAAVFVSGIAVSVQVFLGGRLAGHLGSAELAGSVNHLGGLLAVVAVCTVTGVPRRAARRLADGPGLRWWHVAAGLNGAFFIVVAAHVAPRVGVALLTVALVCGQTSGSLVADRAGISPAGRKPLTAFRVGGATIALVAVALAAAGTPGDPELGLLALAVLAGSGVAVQQAALGHTAQATGEPLAASAINLAGGAVAVVVVALITTGGSAPGGWSAPPQDWIGGVLGATVAVVLSAAVPTIGLLRVMLALVAGQSVGGLLLDVIWPAPGDPVTAITVVGVAMTIAAVVVSGMGARPAARSAPA